MLEEDLREGEGRKRGEGRGSTPAIFSTSELEKAAPKCRGEKRETGKRRTKNVGLENSGKGVTYMES